MNQEAYGNLITNPDLQFFPYGVYIEELGQWHQATFFYESALNTLLLIVMLIGGLQSCSALVGAAGGWLFCAFDGLFERLSERMGERPVATALIAGLVLALMGIALPFTMFAGEPQVHLPNTECEM